MSLHIFVVRKCESCDGAEYGKEHVFQTMELPTSVTRYNSKCTCQWCKGETPLAQHCYFNGSHSYGSIKLMWLHVVNVCSDSHISILEFLNLKAYSYPPYISKQSRSAFQNHVSIYALPWMWEYNLKTFCARYQMEQFSKDLGSRIISVEKNLFPYLLCINFSTAGTLIRKEKKWNASKAVDSYFRISKEIKKSTNILHPKYCGKTPRASMELYKERNE